MKKIAALLIFISSACGAQQIASTNATGPNGSVIGYYAAGHNWLYVPVDSNGYLMVDCPGCTGGGTPGGSVNDVQFNNTTFGGDSSFTFNSSTKQVSVASLASTGTCPLTGSGSGLGCWIGTTSATLPSGGNSGFDGIVAGVTALYAAIGVAAPTPLLTQASLQSPQIAVLTSASGTYTTPTGAIYLKVTAQGCGGAGAGSGTGASDGGNCASGNTTFGASITAGFGGGGSAFYSYGGTGGTATGGNDNRAGDPGGSAIIALATGPGGNGAGGCSGGGGHGGWTQGGFFTGSNATSPGGGGGGAAATGVANPGGGGGAGGCVYALITSPASTYAYAIGGGSTGGGAGTSGSAGGNGAAGQIIVEAYFQ